MLNIFDYIKVKTKLKEKKYDSVADELLVIKIIDVLRNKSKEFTSMWHSDNKLRDSILNKDLTIQVLTTGDYGIIRPKRITPLNIHFDDIKKLVDNIVERDVDNLIKEL